MADDRDEKRRLRRELEECSVPAPPLRKDAMPPGRPTPDCDVPTVPEADSFSPPEPCPPAPVPATVIPDPLVLTSPEVTASCPADPPKNGPLGGSVTIPAGTYEDSYHFQTITGIVSTQLTYISTLESGDRDELADPDTSVARIVELTGLNESQAQEIKDGVAEIRLALLMQAQDAAYAALDCYWENTEQSASCPAGAITNAQRDAVPSEIPDEQKSFVNNPSTIPAGTYRSSVSQEDADARAMDAALRGLKCLYGNEETYRDCTDIGYEYEEELIDDVDDVPDTRDGQLRTGHYIVPALHVFSHTSVAEANQVAAALADSFLNCFYPNPLVTRTCSDVGRYTDTGPLGPPVMDEEETAAGLRGRSVTVPAGFLVSHVNTADATAMAIAYADSLLDCWGCNTEVTVTCPPQEYTSKDGSTQTRPPNASLSVPISVTIPECSYRSEISAEDALISATAMATSQLNCVYCNPRIPPACVPSEYYDASPNAIVLAYDSSWSKDATAGQLEDTYCCEGPQGAQNCYEIADGVASVPVDDKKGGEDCRFGNDPQTHDCADEGSPPALGGVITIPANTFMISASSGGKAAANSLALAYAQSVRDCYWENDQQQGECPLGTLPTLYTVSAGFVRSYVSKANANDQAKSLAQARTTCTPTTPDVDVSVSGGLTCNCECEEDEELIMCPEFPVGFSVNVGEGSAENPLYYCEKFKVCAKKGNDGEPGNSGAQTGCAGNCAAYYS